MTGAPITLSTPARTSRVTRPDMELWWTTYVRACAAVDGLDVAVGNKEPTDLRVPLARPIIVIRDDGGPRLSHITFDHSVGASVLAGSRLNDKIANDTARWLAAVMHDIELPTLSMPTPVAPTPIVAVEIEGCNGPIAVTESLDVARRYITGQYTIAGTY